MSSDTTNEKDELTAAYMAGRESAMGEVRELKARIAELEAEMSSATEPNPFADYDGELHDVRDLLAADTDPTGGHDA